MKYKSLIYMYIGSEVKVKVKVFVHADVNVGQKLSGHSPGEQA